MAPTVDPKLALSFSGTIGHVITASRWKGCAYFRPYSFPSRGKTAAQSKVREMFGAAISAWKSDFKDKTIREDWDRSATYANTPMSGYNMFLASAYHAAVTDPQTVFIKSYFLDGDHLVFAPGSVSDAPLPDVSQKIDIWIGYNPHTQTYRETRDFRYGEMWSPIFPGPGTYYIKLTSDGVPVSGLIRIVYPGAP